MSFSQWLKNLTLFGSNQKRRTFNKMQLLTILSKVNARTCITHRKAWLIWDLNDKQKSTPMQWYMSSFSDWGRYMPMVFSRQNCDSTEHRCQIMNEFKYCIKGYFYPAYFHHSHNLNSSNNRAKWKKTFPMYSIKEKIIINDII